MPTIQMKRRTIDNTPPPSLAPGEIAFFLGTTAIQMWVGDANGDPVLQGGTGLFVQKSGDTMSGDLAISKDAPKLTLEDINATLDEKRWVIDSELGTLSIGLQDDAGLNPVSSLILTRVGALTSDAQLNMSDPAVVAELPTANSIVTRRRADVRYVATFETRADAEAAFLPAPAMYINVDGLDYKQDAAGTALITNGGATKWSPHGTLSPRHFAAAADHVGKVDDTAAFNAMFDYIRALTYGSDVKLRPVKIDGGPYIYFIGGSVNMTELQVENGLSIHNLYVYSEAFDKSVFDLAGSRFTSWWDVYIQSGVDAATTSSHPWAAISLPRTLDGDGVTIHPCKYHNFYNVHIDGFYRGAAVHNNAAEEIYAVGCHWWNRRVADGSTVRNDPTYAPSYAVIFDAWANIYAKSDYATVLQDTKDSFSMNHYVSSKFQKPFGIAGPTVYFADMTSVIFDKVYLTNGGGAAIEWHLKQGFQARGIEFNGLQVETNGNQNVVRFVPEDGDVEYRIDGLTMTTGNLFVTEEVFHYPPGATGTLIINRPVLDFPHWQSGEPPNGIFNDHTKFALYDVDISTLDFSGTILEPIDDFIAFTGKVFRYTDNSTTYYGGLQINGGIEVISGQVTLPIDPVDGVDATRKSYVDQATAMLNSGTAIFNDYDYIAADQLAHIRNNDMDSQDATVVTAGLQAMHQAAMDYMTINTSATARLDVLLQYRGLYAVNDELFPETFAEDLWQMTGTAAQGHFIFKGPAQFRAKGWPSHKAVRTSGFYGQEGITDAVPMAMFRWEQSEKRGFGPDIEDIELWGEKAVTDPMGFKGRNLNLGLRRNFKMHNFLNVGRWIDDVNNTDSFGEIVSACGFQPTQSGGTGFLSSTVTASTVAGATTSTVTTTEAVFVADHVGKWIMVDGAGEGGSVFCATITSVDSTTQATVDRVCANDVTGAALSFHMIMGGINSGSDQLVLETEVSLDLTGRYVMVPKAGSTVHSEADVLVTRVIAQAVDNKTLTLATAAASSIASTPVCVAPSRYIGKCDDQITSGGIAETGHNNDCQDYGERVEFSFDQVWGSAVTAVETFVYATQRYGGKLHGTSPGFNNFGANGMARWFDNCKLVQEFGTQHTWGYWSPEYGQMCVFGARNFILLDGMHTGNTTAADHTALFYLHQKTPGSTANVRLLYSGFSNMNETRWGLADQDVVRSTGTPLEAVRTMGPFGSRAMEGYPDAQALATSDIEVYRSGTPRITLFDTTNGDRARMISIGGSLQFQQDAAGDGSFENTYLNLNAAEASVQGALRAGSAELFMGAGAVTWLTGSGSPEGVVPADPGSLYTDTGGGAGVTLYVKESGTGNTGWVAK